MPPRPKTHKRKGRTDPAVERDAQKETRKAVTAFERKRRAEDNPPKKTRKKTKVEYVVEEPTEEQPVEDESAQEQPAQDKSEDESLQSGSEELGSGDDDGEDDDGEDGD